MAGAREPVQEDDVGRASRHRSPRPTRYLPAAARVRATSSRAAASPEPCTSPGSRSTPLVLSLVRDGRLSVPGRTSTSAAPASSRSGWRRRPAARRSLACTSGTAAANYLPAVIEAREARVPLIVLTADRPPELRDVGAGQAIDQIKLYGDAVEVVRRGRRRTRRRRSACAGCARSPAARCGRALGDRPGPVHLNFPLREPLVLDGPLPAGARRRRARRTGGPGSCAAAGRARAATATLAQIAEEGQPAGWSSPGREEGGSHPPRAGLPSPLGRAASAFAAAAGWPLLADPLSGARVGDLAAPSRPPHRRTRADGGGSAWP